VKRFSYVEPTTVEEALEKLNEYGDDAKLIAGGTALVNFMKNELVSPRVVIGLRRLASLISLSHLSEVRIGSLTTIQSLATANVVAAKVPLLASACHQVATVRIRMMATLGGAMAHADPALDTPPALMASDASIVIRSIRAQRTVPVDKFFKGIFETALEPNELISEIVVPQQPVASGAAFLKFLPATHDDCPTVSVAARVGVKDGLVNDARIALGAVGRTPIRAEAAERALIGMKADEAAFREIGALVSEAIEPMSDIRGSADYKRDMAILHVRRALSKAAERASATGEHQIQTVREAPS
jgi:carbon-monoxide dehydrogenase medium subunit